MLESIASAWKAEAGRRVLWLPVVFAGGIALYYALAFEPPWFLFPAITALLIGLTFVLSKTLRVPLAVLTMFFAGASWASLRTSHEEVVLREALSPRPLVGVVRDIQRTEHGVRLTLGRVTVDDLPAEKTPRLVRVSVRLKKDSTLALPKIGDGIGLRAGLMPPMGPALPHGFDFARYFSLRGIGAVGYGLPPWEIIAPDQSPTFANRFSSWRVALTEDIIATLGKETGAVAAGLITGDAKAIREADFDALRASNLYHIIAISGEHMVVIAGVIFISLRLLALLLPSRVALRPQVKSFAAAITLLLITAYLFVTGLPVSAVRAYVMIVLVLFAVILRRNVDAMRSLGLAGFAMLLYNPADLLDPGFQLSFAATLAILALVEFRLLAPPAIEHGRVRRAFHLLLTMLLVSVVAEAATAPIVITLFNNLSLYGVFANMLATPLVSLFLMPVVALYFILLPLGFSHAALWLMDFGIRALLALARFISELPHAQFFVPSLPGYGVALFACGLLWICLLQGRARRFGLVAMVLSVATLAFNNPPDMLVGVGAKQIAFRTDAGYVLARGRANSMVPEIWANGLGEKQLPKAEKPQWQCDTLGCVAMVRGKRVAFPNNGAALLDDCRRADIVVTPLMDISCPPSAMVIDGAALLKNSVTALWMGKTIRREYSSDWQGNRPWSALADEADEAED